jgi:SOS-response transcriptional repressor LexA
MTNEYGVMQERIFDTIKAHIAEYGHGPTVREIMNAVGLKSVNTVAYHVDRLCARGLIEKDPYSARSIRLANVRHARDRRMRRRA